MQILVHPWISEQATESSEAVNKRKNKLSNEVKKLLSSSKERSASKLSRELR
jgi:hypothetical protein